MEQNSQPSSGRLAHILSLFNAVPDTFWAEEVDYSLKKEADHDLRFPMQELHDVAVSGRALTNDPDALLEAAGRTNARGSALMDAALAGSAEAALLLADAELSEDGSNQLDPARRSFWLIRAALNGSAEAAALLAAQAERAGDFAAAAVWMAQPGPEAPQTCVCRGIYAALAATQLKADGSASGGESFDPAELHHTAPAAKLAALRRQFSAVRTLRWKLEGKKAQAAEDLLPAHTERSIQELNSLAALLDRIFTAAVRAVGWGFGLLAAILLGSALWSRLLCEPGVITRPFFDLARPALALYAFFFEDAPLDLAAAGTLCGSLFGLIAFTALGLLCLTLTGTLAAVLTKQLLGRLFNLLYRLKKRSLLPRRVLTDALRRSGDARLTADETEALRKAEAQLQAAVKNAALPRGCSEEDDVYQLYLEMLLHGCGTPAEAMQSIRRRRRAPVTAAAAKPIPWALPALPKTVQQAAARPEGPALALEHLLRLAFAQARCPHLTSRCSAQELVQLADFFKKSDPAAASLAGALAGALACPRLQETPERAAMFYALFAAGGQRELAAWYGWLAAKHQNFCLDDFDLSLLGLNPWCARLNEGENCPLKTRLAHRRLCAGVPRITPAESEKLLAAAEKTLAAAAAEKLEQLYAPYRRMNEACGSRALSGTAETMQNALENAGFGTFVLEGFRPEAASSAKAPAENEAERPLFADAPAEAAPIPRQTAGDTCAATQTAGAKEYDREALFRAPDTAECSTALSAEDPAASAAAGTEPIPTADPKEDS